MTNDLVLNSVSAAQIDEFIKHPAHLLIIIGPDGIGKGVVANKIMSEVLSIPVDKVLSNPNIFIIGSPSSSITIDEVRELQKFMRLKTPGHAQFRRGVIIEHSDKLTIEAQNALLKLFEEPPDDSLILLTVSGRNALLKTIYSRAQNILIKNIDPADLSSAFEKLGFENEKINQALLLSNFLPGLAYAILSNESEHPILESVENVKKLLGMNRYQRLVLVPELTKDKQNVKELILAIQRVAQASIDQAAKSTRASGIKQWQAILKLALKADVSLEYNGNVRLVLTDLFLNM